MVADYARRNHKLHGGFAYQKKHQISPHAPHSILHHTRTVFSNGSRKIDVLNDVIGNSINVLKEMV